MAQHSQPVAQEQEQHMPQQVHHQILQQELTQTQPTLLPTPSTTPQPNYNNANNNSTLTPTRSFTPSGVYGGGSGQSLLQPPSLAAAPSIYNPTPNVYMPSSNVQTNTAMYSMPSQIPYNVTGNVNMHNWTHPVPPYSATHYLQSELSTDHNSQMMHTIPTMQMSMGNQGPVSHSTHGGGSGRFHQYQRRSRGRGGNNYRRSDYNHHHHHNTHRNPPPPESPLQQNIEPMQHISAQHPSMEQHIANAPQGYSQHPQYVHAQSFQAIPYSYMTHQSHIQVHPSSGVAAQATGAPMYVSQVPVYNAAMYNYGYVYPMLNAAEYQYVPAGGEESHIDNRGGHPEGVMQPIWHSQAVYQSDYGINPDVHDHTGDDLNHNAPSLCSTASSGMMSPNYPMYEQQQVHEMHQQPLVPMYENQQLDYIQGIHTVASIPHMENGTSLLQPGVPMHMNESLAIPCELQQSHSVGVGVHASQSTHPATVLCERNAQTDSLGHRQFEFVQEDTNRTHHHVVAVEEPPEIPKPAMVSRSDATFQVDSMRKPEKPTIQNNNTDGQWPKSNTPQQKPTEKLQKGEDLLVNASVQTMQVMLNFEDSPPYSQNAEEAACKQFRNLKIIEQQTVDIIQTTESVKTENSVETLNPVDSTKLVHVMKVAEPAEAPKPVEVAKSIESPKSSETKKSVDVIKAAEAVKPGAVIKLAEGFKAVESLQSRSPQPQKIPLPPSSPTTQTQQPKQTKNVKQTQKTSNKQKVDVLHSNTQSQTQEHRKPISQQSLAHPSNTASKKKQQQQHHHQQQQQHQQAQQQHKQPAQQQQHPNQQQQQQQHPNQQQQHHQNSDKSSNGNKNQYSLSQQHSNNDNNKTATNNNNNNKTLATDSDNMKISHKKATASISVTALPPNNNNNNIINQKQMSPGHIFHNLQGHHVESPKQHIQHQQLQQTQPQHLQAHLQLSPQQSQAQEQHQPHSQPQPQLHQRVDRETLRQPKALEQKIDVKSELLKHQKNKTERKNSSGRALPTSPIATTVVSKSDRRVTSTDVSKHFGTQNQNASSNEAGQALSPSVTEAPSSQHNLPPSLQYQISLATVETPTPPNAVQTIDTTANIAAATTTTAAASAPAVAAAPAPTAAMPSTTTASAPTGQVARVSWAALFTGNHQSTGPASSATPNSPKHSTKVSSLEEQASIGALTATSASVTSEYGATASEAPATQIAAGTLSYSAASAQGLPTVAVPTQTKAKQQTLRQHESASSSRQSSLSHDEWGIRYAEHLLKYNPELAPVSLRPRGLTNRSNYCYINAILQALLGCAPFVNMIRAIPHQIANQSGTKTPTLSAMISLISAFSNLPNGQRLRNTRKSGPRNKDDLDVELGAENSFEPSELYTLWNNSRDEPAEGRQEDAEEFLGYALNKMNDEMLEVIKLVAKPQNGENIETEDGDAWQMICNNKNKNNTRQSDLAKTPLSDIFRGELRSRLQREGEHSTDSFQPFFTLQLNIEKAASVKEAIEILVERDQVEGVTGSKSKQEVVAWQQVTLEKLPIILILHLKWFDYKTEGCTKILKKVEFPIELVLDTKTLASKKYMPKERTYRLFAVVYHDGKEASKGHYVTDVYHTGYSSWLRFDDSSVKQVRENYVLTPRSPRVPYLLYYRRCDTMQSPPPNSQNASSYSMRGREHK